MFTTSSQDRVMLNLRCIECIATFETLYALNNEMTLAALEWVKSQKVGWVVLDLLWRIISRAPYGANENFNGNIFRKDQNN